MVKRVIFSIYYYFFAISTSIVLPIFLFFISIVLFKKKNIIIHAIVRLWGKLCVRLSFSSVKIIDKRYIDKKKNYIIVANHTSNFDIFLLLGFLGLNTIFLSKQSNFKIPLIGWVMKSMGCIPVNRKNKRSALASIEAAAKVYQEGLSVIFFPEGTRNQEKEISKFKEGFMHIAKKTPVEVLPVAIKGANLVQQAKKITVFPAEIVVTVCQPMPLDFQIVTNPKKKKAFVDNVESLIREKLS